jgi:hypothetical protein
MSIKFVKKAEWLEQTKKSETVLIGAFMPNLSLIAMEADCRECGRTVYIAAGENDTAKILCILCGLKLVSMDDQEIFAKFLTAKQREEG